jgi:osmotically inducible protein OsmC
MNRKATVIWKGTGKEGSGSITTESRTLDSSHYAWNSRFESQTGTNPEELIAAAHAACFTMKLSFLLNAAGITADKIETVAEVTLGKDELSHSHLSTKVSAPGLDDAKLQELAEFSRANCIVSKALNLEITMDASLV